MATFEKAESALVSKKANWVCFIQTDPISIQKFEGMDSKKTVKNVGRALQLGASASLFSSFIDQLCTSLF